MIEYRAIFTAPSPSPDTDVTVNKGQIKTWDLRILFLWYPRVWPLGRISNRAQESGTDEASSYRLVESDVCTEYEHYTGRARNHRA